MSEKTNIIFMINVPGKDGTTKPEYEYSIKSWNNWADLHGYEVLVMDEPAVDMNAMHIIWQRYFLFDMLDQMGIDVDQALMVDADTIVHPNCPDLFELTDHRYTGVAEMGSYDWVLRSMEHYRDAVFKGEWFPFCDYINSGFQIVNQNHREFFGKMVQLYMDNQYTFRTLQERYHTGTDQTPLNFMLRREGVDFKFLPYEFNMGCMNKREIADEELTFTKIGWVYHFNGLPNKTEVAPYLMKKTYDRLWQE